MLFTDDTVLVADSKRKLKRFVKELPTVCIRSKLKVKVVKNKVTPPTSRGRSTAESL